MECVEGNGSLRFWNLQIFTNLLSEEVVDLSMTRDGGCPAGGSVHLHAVTSSFSKKLYAMTFEVPDQIHPLHEMEASGSRITTLLRRDSSASDRFDSNTNWTAS